MPILPSEPLNLGNTVRPLAPEQGAGGIPPEILQALRMQAQASQAPPPVQGFQESAPMPQQGIQGPQMNQPMPMMGEPEAPINEGGMTFNPNTEVSDQFMELMKNYPTRDIGILERIANSMLGATDPRLAMANMRAPSQEQLDWQQRAKYLGQGAREERYGNQLTQRYLLGQDKADIAAGRLAETERSNRAKEQLKALALDQPELKKFAQPGGNVMLIDMNTGQVTDTGIESGTLTDLDKLEMGAVDDMALLDARAQAAMERTQATVAGAAARTTEQQTGATERTRMQQEGAGERTAASVAGAAERNQAAIEGRAELKRLYPTAGSRQSALDQRRGFYNAAAQWQLDNPEKAKKWLVLGDDEDVSVVQPPGEGTAGFFGRGDRNRPSQQEYDQMIAEIRSAASSAGAAAMPDLEQGVEPIATGGKVRVRNLETGQTGSVSPEVLAAYPERYEEIP